MKRIAVLRFNYYPQEAHLARNIQALAEEGFQIDIICLRGNLEKKVEKNGSITVYRLNINKSRKGKIHYLFTYLLFFLKVFIKLSVLSFKKKYDAVEVVTMPDFLVFSTVIAKLRKSKIVIYLFENMPELYATDYGKNKDDKVVKLLKFIEQRAICYADKAIAVSQESMNLFLSKKVKSEKFTIVLNVPDIKHVSPIPEEPKNTKFTIVSHGTIVPRYGYDVAIKALKIVSDNNFQFQYKLIGNGEHIPKLKEMVKEFNLEDKIEFAGFIEFEKLMALLSTANLALIPIHTQYQMLPNKLFEYIHLKIPVICSNVPAIQNIFNQNSILYFDDNNHTQLADHIIFLMQNPETIKNMVLLASEQYSSVCWEKEKIKYIGLYKTLN